MKHESASTRIDREIAHHRGIAARAEEIWNWDSPAGECRADRRASMFIEHGALRPGRRALELGCGTGVFLARVAPSGVTLWGIDLSRDLLHRAADRVAHLRNVQLSCGNAEQLPYPDDCFDTVYGSSILHHLELESALREVFRCLRRGGALVFTEPNIFNPQVAFMFHFGPTKAYFGVSPDEMAFSRFHARSALDRVGFTEMEVTPFDFLHPATPERWLPRVGRFGERLERTPLVREIAGSLLVTARKP